MEIKYINPIAIKLAESIVTDLEVADRKLLTLVFPIGCKIAETSFNIKLKITISNSGDSIVVIINKIPTKPIEFLIRTELAKIKSIPSER